MVVDRTEMTLPLYMRVINHFSLTAVLHPSSICDSHPILVCYLRHSLTQKYRYVCMPDVSLFAHPNTAAALILYL